MVMKVSTELFLPNEHRIPVAQNHTDMVKFLSPSDLTYCSVSTRIYQCVDKIAKEAGMYWYYLIGGFLFGDRHN
jgi:hypothetical protein